MAAAPVIHSVQLKGHQAAISCLDHSSGCATSVRPSLLLSGFEDGTCRLWDLRIGRSVSCIKQCSGSNCSGEVLSVAFGPGWKTSNADSEEEKSPFSHDFSVYTAVDNCVYGYDLRKASSPIVTEPSVDLSALLEAPDDVNQIAFSPIRAAPTPTSNKKGNRKKAQSTHTPIHMAAVDDGGSVRVTADWAPNSERISGNKRVFCHGDDAMVTSLAFAPKNSNNKQQYLASGGTDCCIRIWDIAIQQQTKPVVSFTISNTDAGANQVCNPPFVHSLEYSPSGRLLAAGLGDGSIAIVQGQVVTARLDDAHTGSVASCLFPAWKNNNSAITAHDRLLCSIGNDGCIVLWDLGATISGDKATNPSDLLQTMSFVASEQEKLQNMSLQDKDEELFDQPKTLFAFQHSAGKPNWMISGRAHDPVFPSSIFVADTSNDISIYTIPVL